MRGREKHFLKGYIIKRGGNFSTWSYNYDVEHEFYIAKVIEVVDVYSDRVLETYYSSYKTPILSEKSYKKIANSNKFRGKDVEMTEEFLNIFKNEVV